MNRKMSLTNRQIVAKICLWCIVVAVVNPGGSAAFALDPMGPPLAGLREGQFSFGADVALGETDLKLVDGTWVNTTITPSTGVTSDKTVDFETTKLLATAGYGFARNWEAFLGIGATKAEFGDDLWSVGEDFDSGIGLGVRGGVKTTLFEIPELNLQIGALLQLNWANYDGKLDVPQQAGPDFVEVDLIEMQIAVGATYPCKEGITVYGGPFVHYISGDLEELDTVGAYDITWEIDEGPTWGAYIGAQMEIAPNCVFNIEYQHSSDANVLGASLMWKFGDS